MNDRPTHDYRTRIGLRDAQAMVRRDRNHPAIVGDNPFQLAESGAAGAVWVRTLPGAGGTIQVTARHSALGEKSVCISVRPLAVAT
jgi:hypothetical protein